MDLLSVSTRSDVEYTLHCLPEKRATLIPVPVRSKQTLLNLGEALELM